MVMEARRMEARRNGMALSQEVLESRPGTSTKDSTRQ